MIREEDLDQLVHFIKQKIQEAARPANETILDDVDLRNMMKVSKRTTAYWREKGMVTFAKLGGKIFYKLSDVLLMIKKYEIPAADTKIKIRLLNE